jgi:hypothetical protein
MARSKSISIPITGNSAPLRKELKKASQELSAFGKAQAAWSQASALAYGVVGSAAAQFAISSVKAAMDDQKAQAVLAKSLQNTVGANEQAVKAAESYIETLMYATNIVDDKLRPALATLVRTTGDMTKAQRLLSLATDVSIGGNIDLETVVKALTRASMGQTSALGRLGLGLSSAALNSGDLATVTEELSLKFGGSAAAAAETMAGKMENLTVRFGELKEQIGTELLPVVTDGTEKLLDFTSALQSGDLSDTASSLYNLADGLGDMVRNLTPAGFAINFFKNLNPLAKETEETIRGLTDATNESAAAFRKFDDLFSRIPPKIDEMRKRNAEYQKNVSDYVESRTEQEFAAIVEERNRKIAAGAAAQQKAEAANTAARKSYKETGKALRESLNEALDDSRKKLAEAKEAADDFGRGLAFSFGVSLAGAYDKATQSEDDYTAALEDRKKAYAALDVAKQGDDLNAYLKAVQDVATAEQAVTTAQKARITPASAFAAQVEAAKTFGTNLKTLIGQGLGEAGLQQLLDLGPTAGAEVTKALLDGTAGFTVGGLNQSLADLANVQAGLAAGITSRLAPTGAISAAQSQVDALSSASIGAPGVGQGFTININTGVGDPVAIGRQVKEILGQYDNRAGTLVVQGPKKKAKKK